MKVHKFQIEVMWLMLAVSPCTASGTGSFCGFSTDEKYGFMYQHDWIKKGIPKDPHSPIEIRPPPPGGEL